jgi:hypothetical protein
MKRRLLALLLALLCVVGLTDARAQFGSSTGPTQAYGRFSASAARGWTPNKIGGLYFRLDPTLLSPGLVSTALDAAGSGRSLAASGSGRPTADSSVTWGPKNRQTLQLTASSVLYSASGGITGASPFTLGRIFRYDATTGYLSLILGATSGDFAGLGDYAGSSAVWGGHQYQPPPDGQIYIIGTGSAPDTTTVHVAMHTFDGTYSRLYYDGVLWPLGTSETGLNYNNPSVDAGYNNASGYGFAPHSPGDEAVEHVGEAIIVRGVISPLDAYRWHQWGVANLGPSIGPSSATLAQFAGGINSRDNGYRTTTPSTDNLLSQTAALLSMSTSVSVLGITGQTLTTFLSTHGGLYPEQTFAGHLSMLAQGPRIAWLGSMADNDLGCGGAAATSLATAQANAVALVAAARAYCPGAIVVAATMLPAGNTSTASTYSANRLVWNTWLLAGGSGADVVADTGTIAALQSLTGSYWSGDPGGNIHLSTSGVALQAAVVAAAIARWIQ